MNGERDLLSAEDIESLRDRLAAMKPFEVENFYKATHNACAYHINGRIPCPRAVQEFVQAWKALRKAR
jgi:hypothetical protein